MSQANESKFELAIPMKRWQEMLANIAPDGTHYKLRGDFMETFQDSIAALQLDPSSNKLNIKTNRHYPDPQRIGVPYLIIEAHCSLCYRVHNKMKVKYHFIVKKK